MHKTIDITAWVALGLLGVILLQSPPRTAEVWAADEQTTPGRADAAVIWLRSHDARWRHRCVAPRRR